MEKVAVRELGVPAMTVKEYKEFRRKRKEGESGKPEADKNLFQKAGDAVKNLFTGNKEEGTEGPETGDKAGDQGGE